MHISAEILASEFIDSFTQFHSEASEKTRLSTHYAVRIVYPTFKEEIIREKEARYSAASEGQPAFVYLSMRPCWEGRKGRE